VNFNFELILSIIFLIAFAFWLINKFVVKQEEGLIEFTASLAPVLGLVLVLRSFMIEPFQIPSKSMVPTLKVGDFILVSKWSYGLRLPVLRTKIFDVDSPKRGDVVVFFPPHEERYFIKRLVGLPGDKIQVINGKLYVNNAAMPQTDTIIDAGAPRSQVMMEDLDGVEHLIQKRVPPTRMSQNFSTLVPQGHYFMMGDSRDNSSDSRVWGPVPEERIVGKAFARWMFWDDFLSVPSFSRAGKIQ
jgi:signal peptidase I|tara:strand:- start:4 stop:735 length:732 start_codon:yes stop_codon:yes gene_type:complete